ncbi:hypothetical protein PFISCL1PPCAC_23446, partial [Pristionchus fissidentatus]
MDYSRIELLELTTLLERGSSYNLRYWSWSTGEFPFPLSLHRSNIIVMMTIRHSVAIAVQVLPELSVFIVCERLLAAASRRLRTARIPVSVGAAEAAGDDDDNDDDDGPEDTESDVEGGALEGLEEGRSQLGWFQLVTSVHRKRSLLQIHRSRSTGIQAKLIALWPRLIRVTATVSIGYLCCVVVSLRVPPSGRIIVSATVIVVPISIVVVPGGGGGREGYCSQGEEDEHQSMIHY